MTAKKEKKVHVLKPQTPRVRKDADVPFGCEPSTVKEITDRFCVEQSVPAEVEVVLEPTVDDELAKILKDEPTEITEELLKKYRELGDEIKNKSQARTNLRDTIMRLHGAVDDKEKVVTLKKGKETLTLSRKNGAVSMEWKDYVTAMLSAKEWKDLEDLKKLVSQNKGTSVYMTKRKDSFDVEVSSA